MIGDSRTERARGDRDYHPELLRCFKDGGSCRTAYPKISTNAGEKKLREAMVLGWWFSPWLDSGATCKRESEPFSSQGEAEGEKIGSQQDGIARAPFRVAVENHQPKTIASLSFFSPAMVDILR